MKKEEVDLSKLSKREQMYYKVLRSNSGVLNLIGRPGVSKTSTLRALAKKMGWAFFDLRLTTMDETDLGSYPLLRQLDDIDVVTYAIPDWAIEANKANQGALIVFEELNRANITLRNAALKVLLEKEIGTKFKFANHVHMCATGNLGADDDTEVETFDAALKSRLITFEHKMDLEEWSEEFGNDNIHSDIMYFLKHNPHQYHPTVKTEDARTITNPRTWTFLSDYIIANFGKDSRYAEYKHGQEIELEWINGPIKATIIKKNQIHDKDTGSPEVQIAMISERIDELALHLKKHKKDNHSRRGLIKMVADRRTHLKHLEKSDKSRHEKVAKKLKTVA